MEAVSTLEYKFAVPPGEIGVQVLRFLESLAHIEGNRVITRESENLCDRYYDTPDFFFERNHKAIRQRIRNGTPPILEVKDSVPPSHEHRVYRRRSHSLAERRPAKQSAGALPAILQAVASLLTGVDALQHVVTIRNHRTRLIFHPRGTKERVSLHLDRYVTETAAGDKEKGCEVEVHAVPTAEQAALNIVMFLRNALGLIPIRQSKLGRGLAIVRGGLANPSARKKVILDMDVGVDDALALLMALRSGCLDVLAVTAVGGNVPVSRVAGNVAFLLSMAGAGFRNHVSKAIPYIAIGGESGGGRRDASDVHGPDGMGGVTTKPAYRKWVQAGQRLRLSQDAGQVVSDLLRAHPAADITLVTTGPLSNVADWIAKYPEPMSRLKAIIAMGGVFFDSGNRSPAAEFNIHADPTAARTVVEFCRAPVMERYAWRERVPLTFVGLDVTHRVTLQRRHVEEAAADGRVGKTLACFVRDLTAHYMDFYRRNEGLDGCYLHDPLAVGYAIDPRFCKADQYHVEIEDKGEFTSGASVADYRPTRIFKDRGKEVTWVCYQVRSADFESYVHRTLGL